MTLRELLAALGYDAENGAEEAALLSEYADGYMVEDLGGNLYVDLGEGEDGEGMSILAKMSFYSTDGIRMWTLDAPFTVSGFNRYLDELDIRVRRLRAIVELPGAGESNAEGDDGVSIAGVLGALFERDETVVVQQLGDSWTAIDSVVIGSHSTPARYLLWGERLVVGLDDEYAHFFAATFGDGEFEVGEVVSSLHLGDGATIELEEFARALRDARALL